MSGVRPQPFDARDGSPARDLWALDPARIHLNHGSFGGSPVFARRRRAELLAELEANPIAFYIGLPPRLAEARARLAPFLGAEPDEVAFVPNASAGTTVALAALDLNPGDEIVATDHTYGALAMALGALAERTGATVRVVTIPLSAGADAVVSLLEAALTDRTAALVVDHVSSGTARMFPVDRLSVLAAERGIPFIVDGAHAPGYHHRPAAEIARGVWVGNLHKFALGQRGTAAIVARTPESERLHPLIASWGAAEPYPARFDSQGTVDATPYLASVDAIEWVERTLGWDRVRSYGESLLDYGSAVIDGALGGGALVDVGMPASGMRLLRLPTAPGADAAASGALRQRLADELGFETQLPHRGDQRYLRLSAHAYNTPEHFEAFAKRAVPWLTRNA